MTKSKMGKGHTAFVDRTANMCVFLVEAVLKFINLVYNVKVTLIQQQ